VICSKEALGMSYALKKYLKVQLLIVQDKMNCFKVAVKRSKVQICSILSLQNVFIVIVWNLKVDKVFIYTPEYRRLLSGRLLGIFTDTIYL